MSAPVYSRELVATRLRISRRLMARYEALGLVHPVRDAAGTAGYDPAQVRRLWTIVSLQRDLGVNLAGVEAILRLREHVDRLHASVARLATALDQALEEPDEGIPAAGG
jgi:MerR family transcriptional regulator/heat shock protein HspR